MWILTKKLHTSAYVQDTKALGLDLEAFCQLSEKSLTWRGKDSLSRTWLQRWKRESWIQHLSSRTLRPSLTESFVDAWTSSLEDSRVSHSQLLESVKLLKTPDTSSPTSQTESESANLELFSSKTYKESSVARQPTENQFSSMSSEHWKDWVIEQRQEYSQRKKSARLIRESESTYLGWPTARTLHAEGGRIQTEMTEQRVAHVGLQDQANPNTNGKNQESWPTPRANKVHPEITEKNREHLANRKKANLEEDIAGHCGKATGKLNPNWVEHLMGLPAGWTDLGYWGTE